MIKETRVYEYEHEMAEDMSPDRNGDENIEDQRHHREEDDDPIQEKIAKIIQICKEKDGLFGDAEFLPND